MPEPIVHKRLSAAPKQVHFPPRRQNTRRSVATRTAAQKLKRQSTLTQLDFVSTPHSSREVIPDSDDEDDEEFLEAKPKKRRKLDKKSRDQSTLTQNWRRVVEDSEGEGSDVVSEEWEEYGDMMDLPQANKAQDTQGTAKYLYGRMQEESSERHDLPGDAESVATPTLRRHGMLLTSSDAGDGSTRPTTADSKANPRTPRTTRRTEVPSSQTPSSAILSLHKSRNNHRFDQSPLKLRSSTPTPMKKARSETSSPSKRMLRHMESDIHKMDAATSIDLRPKPWKAEVVSSSQQKPTSFPAKRRLVRTTTVQDSQDNFGLEESQNFQAAKTEAANGGDTGTEPAGRSLKRAFTILDSEDGSDLDDIGMDMDDDKDDTELPDFKNKAQVLHPVLRVSQPHPNTIDNPNSDDEMNFNEAKGSASHEYTYTASLHQQTFDPVSAALDRDAARFGRGPTQLVTQHHSYAGFGQIDVEEETEVYEHREDEDEMVEDVYDDVDERVEDSEPEYVAESPMCDADPETQFVADSPPADLQDAPSPELGNFTQASKSSEWDPPVDHPVPDASSHQQSIAVVSNVEDSALPMPISPKQPRPSQVSTVGSTQRTTSRPNSGHGDAPGSPQKSAAWAATFSSSPFPLPPESWRGAQSYRDLETQSSGVFDFSLPPPPPLLSSSRQTPASSSR